MIEKQTDRHSKRQIDSLVMDESTVGQSQINHNIVDNQELFLFVYHIFWRNPFYFFKALHIDALRRSNKLISKH